MTNNLLAMAVVLGIAAIVLAIGYQPLTRLIPKQDLDRLIQFLVIITVCAFVAPSFWIYALVLSIILLFTSSPSRPDESAQAWRATLWLWGVLLVPVIPVELPGFAGINRFLDLHHARILCWLLLLPVVLGLGTNATPAPGAPSNHGWKLLDWLMFGYLSWMALIIFYIYDVSFTNGLRQLVTWLTDYLLPYAAMRLAFSKPAEIKRALAAIATVTSILGLVAVFEVVRSWAVYTQVEIAWGVDWAQSIYLWRDGLLRAQASTGHSLILGYVCGLGLLLWIWLFRFVQPRLIGWLALLAVLAGVAGSLSRATWMTVAFMALFVNALAGRARNLILIGVVGMATLMLLASFVPTFQELLDKMPIIGNPSAEVDLDKEYRTRLFEISLDLIAQSPVFGVPNALAYMEDLRQGQGIIDIVNSYIGIALAYGVTGLALFVGMFAVCIWRMWLLRQRVGKDHEAWHLANCMIALYVMVMILISSVSSIGVIPFLYFALIGLSVSIERAYAPSSSPA